MTLAIEKDVRLYSVVSVFRFYIPPIAIVVIWRHNLCVYQKSKKRLRIIFENLELLIIADSRNFRQKNLFKKEVNFTKDLTLSQT